jgi:hypothetical protein
MIIRIGMEAPSLDAKCSNERGGTSFLGTTCSRIVPPRVLLGNAEATDTARPQALHRLR